MSPTEPASPDYRTKRQSGEREHFHILPQLQAQRSDLLTVILTGTLPQRRGISVPPTDRWEPPGPGEDDVTKSESHSEASQKSTERSQEAAPSTLMAEDQRVREPMSAGDIDPDLEDGSKTLVLFSPGDTRKSPSGGDQLLEAGLATPCALTPCALTPCALTPCALTPCALTPSALAPSALTPSALAPSALTPSALAPSALTPCALTPCALAPSALTPCALTLSVLAPCALTPCALTPCALAPSALAPRALTPCALAPSALAPRALTPCALAPSALAPRALTPCALTLCALSPCAQTDRPLDKLAPPAPAECAETGRLSPALRFELRPSAQITPASPPFTKVERTFIHIAETSHLNVMSSSTQSVREGDQGVLSHPKEAAIELQIHIKREKPQQGLRTQASPEEPSLTDPKCRDMTTPNQSSEPVPEAISEESDVKQSVASKEEPAIEPQESIRPKARSRIPVLASGEDSGSDRSSSTSARAHLQKRARQGDLARLLVQKQQGRWIRKRLISGTSSSLSSMDEERQKASETLSATGSEEDTHTSEESRRGPCLRPTEEHGSMEGWSRIPRPQTPRPQTSRTLTPRPQTPRPQATRTLSTRTLTPRLLTPVKGPSDELPATRPSQRLPPGTSSSKGAAAPPNRLQKFGMRNKPLPVRSGSASCPRPPAGPAQAPPLRTIFGTRRSLSSTHCRTDSPSPHRLLPTRTPLSVRTPPQTQPRTSAPLERGRSRPKAASGGAR
ncbi:unnamed protein product [Arctogadus glacialis]